MPIFSFIGAQGAANAQLEGAQIQADAAREGVDLNRQVANFGIADTSAGRASRDVATANLLARLGLQAPDVRLSNPNAQLGADGQVIEPFDPSGRRLSDIETTPFALSPGAQFVQEQGNRAATSQAASRGLLDSGGTLRDLSRFNAGLASQEFGNDFNRLLQVQGAGQAEGQAARNTASNFGILGAQGGAAAGQAQAQGLTDAANTRATAFGNLGQSLAGIAGGFF